MFSAFVHGMVFHSRYTELKHSTSSLEDSFEDKQRAEHFLKTFCSGIRNKCQFLDVFRCYMVLLFLSVWEPFMAVRQAQIH